MHVTGGNGRRCCVRNERQRSERMKREGWWGGGLKPLLMKLITKASTGVVGVSRLYPGTRKDGQRGARWERAGHVSK